VNAATRAAMGESHYRLLTAAGAPALPDGYAYRIKQDPHSDHVVRVEVRRTAERVGTELLSSATFSIREGLGSVLEAATVACTEAHTAAFPNGVPA
jgi:hypothetical protein